MIFHIMLAKFRVCSKADTGPWRIRALKFVTMEKSNKQGNILSAKADIKNQRDFHSDESTYYRPALLARCTRAYRFN